jgi:hypothetical protein
MRIDRPTSELVLCFDCVPSTSFFFFFLLLLSFFYICCYQFDETDTVEEVMRRIAIEDEQRSQEAKRLLDRLLEV